MNLADALRSCSEAARESYRSGVATSDKSLFEKPEASASELFIAARRHLGPDFVNFEPETLWETFNVEAVNRDQLLAAINVATMASFWWDFRVFGNSSLAFGDHAVNPDAIPRPEAKDMAWAVFEAEMLNGLSDEPAETELGEEVVAYIATVLHEEGFVVAPDLLEEVQETLDRMTSPEGLELKDAILRQWDDLQTQDLERWSPSNDAIGVQLARLAEVRLYLVKRAQHLTERFRRL